MGARGAISGTDLLQPLLKDSDFRAGTLQRFFPAELAQLTGTWMNEYLFYYYFAERALAAIKDEETTRGEEVEERNEQLLDQLEGLDPNAESQAALEVYRRYESGRRSSYMHYAEPADAPAGERTLGEGSEGYAGVALDIIEALVGGAPRFTAANVPNDGCLPDLEPTDVAEISIIADRHGIRPLAIGPVPTLQAGLMKQVKQYERLTVSAILTRSRSTAIQALMSHPLVVSYSRAAALVDDYLSADPALTGNWT